MIQKRGMKMNKTTTIISIMLIVCAFGLILFGFFNMYNDSADIPSFIGKTWEEKTDNDYPYNLTFSYTGAIQFADSELEGVAFEDCNWTSYNKNKKELNVKCSNSKIKKITIKKYDDNNLVVNFNNGNGDMRFKWDGKETNKNQSLFINRSLIDKKYANKFSDDERDMRELRFFSDGTYYDSNYADLSVNNKLKYNYDKNKKQINIYIDKNSVSGTIKILEQDNKKIKLMFSDGLIDTFYYYERYSPESDNKE